jgi:hypothetical protein
MNAQHNQPRSALAEKILPHDGLFRLSTPPSPRGKYLRAGLFGLALVVCILFLFIHGPRAAVLATPGGIALILSAWLLGEGLRAEDHFRATKGARPPRLPLKLIAAGVTGLAVGWLTFVGARGDGAGFAVSAIVAAISQIGCFGLDPRGLQSGAPFAAMQAERVEDHAEQAEAHLASMTTACAALPDADLQTAVAGLTGAVRAVLAELADHPASLPLCRRASGPQLAAFAESCARFAALQTRAPDPARLDEFLRLTDRMQAGYRQLAEDIRLRNNQALSIEWAVLRDALPDRQ